MNSKIKYFKQLKKELLSEMNTPTSKVDRNHVKLTYNFHADGLVRINPYKRSKVLFSLNVHRGDVTKISAVVKHQGKYYQNYLHRSDWLAYQVGVFSNPATLGSDVTNHYMCSLGELLKPKHESIEEYILRIKSDSKTILRYISMIMNKGLYGPCKNRYKYLVEKYSPLLNLLVLIYPDMKFKVISKRKSNQVRVDEKPEGMILLLLNMDNIPLDENWGTDVIDVLRTDQNFRSWKTNELLKLIEWYPQLAKITNDGLCGVNHVYA